MIRNECRWKNAACSIRKIVTSNTFQNCKLAGRFTVKMASKCRWIPIICSRWCDSSHLSYHLARFRCTHSHISTADASMKKKNVFFFSENVIDSFYTGWINRPRVFHTCECRCVRVANELEQNQSSFSFFMHFCMVWNSFFFAIPWATQKCVADHHSCSTTGAVVFVAIAGAYKLYLRLLSQIATCFPIPIACTIKRKGDEIYIYIHTYKSIVIPYLMFSHSIQRTVPATTTAKQ